MRLPPALLALDVLGTLLLGLGIFGLVAAPVELGGFDISSMAIPLIIFGVFLMAPLVIYFVRNILSGKR